MPKPPKKSSATKATQKKKANKKAGKDGEEHGGAAGGAGGPSKKSMKGLSKAEKKALKNGPKVYIPPPKPPAPALPDPLDAQGLARTLPSELVVLLRRLGKKDATTRRKGLDEFKAEWVDAAAEGVREGGDFGEDAGKVEVLVEALPVWIHHLPSLLLSSGHRSLALSVHNKLLSIPTLRSAIVDGLNLGLFTAPHQIRDVIGAWLVSALEEGRRGTGSIGSEGLDLWRELADWSPSEQVGQGRIDMRSQLELLIEYLSLAILEPQQLHEEIHPPQVQVDTSGASTPRKGVKGPVPLPSFPSLPSKNEEDDREAAQAEEVVLPYRSAGLAGLDYILQEMPLDMDMPESLAGLLVKPELWAFLSPDGSSNTNGLIRRGLYSILRTLIRRREEWVGSHVVPVAAPILMRSVWQEVDATVWTGGVLGETLALWLTKFRNVWSLPLPAENGVEEDGNDDGSDGEDDDDSDNSDEDEDEEAAKPDAGSAGDTVLSAPTKPRSLGQESYEAFLGFLQRGCNSQAVEAYPIVLVILSTIPLEILPLERQSLQRLFASFWAPAEAKLLAHHGQGATPSPFMAFTSAIVDCVVYLAAKAWKLAADVNGAKDQTTSTASREDASSLVTEEIGKVWDDGVLQPASRTRGRGGVTEAENQAQVVAKGLLRLHAVHSDLTQGAFQAVEKSSADTKRSIGPHGSKEGSSAHLMNLLQALTREDENAGPLADLAAGVAGQVTVSCVSAIRTAASAGEADPSARLLASTVEARGQDIRRSTEAQTELESLFANDTSKLLAVTTPGAFGGLYSSYLSWCSQAETAGKTYTAVMRTVSDMQHPSNRFQTAESVLRETLRTRPDIQYNNVDLDDLAIHAAEGRNENEFALAFLRLCLSTPGVLSDDTTTGVVTLLSGALEHAVAEIMAPAASSAEDQHAAQLVELVGSLRSVSVADLARSDLFGKAFGSIFDLAFVLPQSSRSSSASSTAARALWRSATLEAEEQDKAAIRTAALERLAGLVIDTDSAASPSSLILVADTYAQSEGTTQDSSAIALETIPKIEWLAQALEAITAGTSAPSSWAVLDPLVPQQSTASGSSGQQQHDEFGRTALARAVEALLSWASMGRASSIDLSAYIPLLAVVGILAKDELAVSGGSRGLYRKDIETAYLVAVADEVDQLVSYWAVSSATRLPADWFSKATSSLFKQDQQADNILVVLQQLANGLVGGTNDAHRAFQTVLSSLLRAADLELPVIDRWMGLAQSIYETRTDAAIAIISVLSELQYESPRLQRFRNEVASNLSGVQANAIGNKGLKLLRVLNAIAPSPDSTSEFLPQQRAVFLMRTINGWLTSDDAADDLPEELESRVAELYQHLCPIVQDIPGAHWESIFDLISNNLEGSSLSDDAARSLQYFTLALLTRVDELATTNKGLRAEWKERPNHLKLALELILEQDSESGAVRDQPRDLVENMVVSLVDSAGATPVTDEMRPKLYNLLKRSGLQVQRLAYSLLSKVIADDIPRLVVKVETSTSDLDEIHSLPKLPGDLVNLVRGRSTTSSPNEAAQRGALFGWMLVFQHFEQASATLRASFIDQLRGEHLLTDNLMPLILQVLGISSTSQRPVDFSRFAVDEFHVSTLEEVDGEIEQALVAHLLYRALVNVPILVRNWYEACKDRQLSLAFSSAVTKHFSPVLIGHEFALLRDSNALQQLEDENLTVKVSSGAAEITASYIIDEQPMEIGVRLPPEFPLRSVEVKDLKRVGVPENKWRGWLLNVQQTITSRNGLILEALTLFKKNVALHFEGVVECAICYSIISMNDKTLPSKPCRTCKKRLHASCLYKWFNSSNSSTCPMCRSLF